MRPVAARILVALALGGLAFGLYTPVRHHAFVAFDDGLVVVENPLVVGGLSPDAVVRAFTTPYEGNWIPLTYVSLQLDRSLHGGSAGGTLLMNAALHAVGTALLFAALVVLTGATWPSAFAAAVFGLHPLHVESVAWASERKDVLSGVFFMLALLAHARYARAPSAPRYLAVVAAVGLGLLSKPMLVTMPFVLLLLDYWPLGRLTRGDGSPWPDPIRLGRAALEKLPLLVLAVAVSVVVLRAQVTRGAAVAVDVLSLPARLANACIAYLTYVGDAFWPTGLAAFYPHPGTGLSRPLALAGALFLLAVSAASLRLAARAPYLVVGWLWYVGTLVPVIGLVQVGMQSHADRYTYLPLIGLSIPVAWGGAALARRGAALRAFVALASAVAVAGMIVVTHRQIPHWRDSRALFARALAVTEGNFFAHAGLGAALDDPVRALPHLEEAVRLNPRYALARIHLANTLARLGRGEEAVAALEPAVREAPDDLVVRSNLGILLVRVGRAADARPHLERARDLANREGATLSAHAQAALADALAATGERERALAGLEERLRDDPADPVLGAKAGDLAREAGRPGRAVIHYRAALAADPFRTDAAGHLAWLLATCAEPDVRDPEAALRLVEGRSEREPRVDLLDALAASYAAVGRFEEAVSAADRAVAAARRKSDAQRTLEVEAHRAVFAAGRAIEEPCGRPSGSADG